MQYSEFFLTSERDAIEQDLTDKYYYSGYCWYFGFDRMVDKAKALSLYKEGSKRKSYKCLYSMGVLSEKNERISNQALGYYKSAFDGLLNEAKKGDILSQRMVSCYYLFGTRGIEKNIILATYWLRKSAIGDNPEAQYNLGESYLFSKGVEKDTHKAFFWLKKALENGYYKAKKLLDKIQMVEQYNCLNLCDLIQFSKKDSKLIEGIIEKFQPKRIYIGSYFCCNYFLKVIENISAIVDICNNKNIMISLVVPIITQQFLKSVKKILQRLSIKYINVIDEVVLNDYSLIDWVKNNVPFDIALGRLFMKDPRDQRIEGGRGISDTPLFVNSQILELIPKYNVLNIELEQIYSSIHLECIPSNVSVAVHTPFCYQTTGQICLYASIKKPLKNKFRANTCCKFECNKMHTIYTTDDGSYLRYGKAVYYKIEESLIKTNSKTTLRKLYWAFNELEDEYENISSIEE